MPHLADSPLSRSPGQQVQEAGRDNNLSYSDYTKAVASIRGTASASINKTLADQKIDVVLGPAEARMASVAAVAAFPVASVPLGFADFNGRVFGMNVISGAGEEGKIFRFMSAWEATFPEARQPPPMLVNWDDANDSKHKSSANI
jgi:amidase